jgi:hypothetical protein
MRIVNEGRKRGEEMVRLRKWMRKKTKWPQKIKLKNDAKKIESAPQRCTKNFVIDGLEHLGDKPDRSPPFPPLSLSSLSLK